MFVFFDFFRADLSRAVPYVAWACTSMVLAVAGPFGSYAVLSFPERLAFWGGAMALGLLVGMSARAFVRGTLGMTDMRAVTVLVALICAALLYWPLWELAQVLYPDKTGFSASLGDTALLVFSVSLTIGAFRGVVDLSAAQSLHPLPEAEARAAPLPRVVLRLEPEMQGRLIAMTVRDHYVDIYTDKGRASLLMRFADAMEETGPEPGDQIHRSHWVAWWAVKGVERSPGKLWVRMCPELRLPVSRTYRERVVLRGLLETPTEAPTEAEPLAAE